jgi:UDP-glucose 4-epimerase
MAATLLTGSRGYVGRLIVDQLLERGDPVVTYDRDYTVELRPGVTAVQGELHDIPRLLATLITHDVGRIIHTAAQSNPDFSLEFPLATFTSNVEGTVHLFEAARLAGVRRIVNYSSECAYGHNPDRIVELETPLRPTTPYGVTKVATELLGDVYNRRFGADILSLRVSEVYGPGQAQPIVLKDMIRAALADQPFRMDKGGDHAFHWIHVEDAARAGVLAASSKSRRQSVFNIAGGGHWTLFEAADIVRDLIPNVRIDIGPGHWYLDRQGPWDLAAAERDLGFVPSMTLAEGIESYIGWLRDHEY